MATTRTRGRRTAAPAAPASIASQITQLVKERDELLAANVTLRQALAETTNAVAMIEAALSVGSGRGRSARRGGRPLALVAPTAASVKVKRTRKPITDPEVLERRRQALSKARAARAEKLEAARAEAADSNGTAAAEPAAEPAAAEA